MNTRTNYEKYNFFRCNDMKFPDVSEDRTTYACCLLPNGKLLGLLFNPGHGSSTFLRNVCEFPLDPITTHPQRQLSKVTAVKTSN
jgi:hypothetical protein